MFGKLAEKCPVPLPDPDTERVRYNMNNKTPAQTGGGTLEKNLSPMNVLSLAVGCMIGWGAFILPGDTFLLKAGPGGTAIALGLSALIMVIIAMNYSFMIQRCPVTGGAFTYTREAFGETHAFVCSWFLSLSYLAIVPLNGTAIALISRVLFPEALQFGFHYSVAGYDVYLAEVVLASAVLALFAILSIRGVRSAGLFENGLVIALVVGILVLSGAAVLQGPPAFANLKPAFSPDTPPVAGVLGIVAVAPWAFAGFETIPQAVEEFRFPMKKTKRLMVASILAGAAVYAILNTITAMIIPEQYGSWVSYLHAVPGLSGLISLPTFHSAHILLGKIGLAFLGLAVLAAILSSIIGFYMATSRLLYSMARAGLLPRWFGEIHGTFKTPANAILFTLLASLAALPFGRTALSWIVNMSSIGASIGSCYTCLAAFKAARREKEYRFLPMAVVGFVMSVVFMVLLLVPIPGTDASLSKASYVCLLVWSVLGALFYGWTRKKNRKA